MYIILEISYNGSFFENLTKQKNYLYTLENYIQHTIYSICNIVVKIYFLSRTDKHVSAKQQFVTIIYNKNIIDNIKSITKKLYIKTKYNARIHKAYICNSLPKRCEQKIYRYRLSDDKRTHINNYCLRLHSKTINNIEEYIKVINNKEIDYKYICKRCNKKTNRPTVASLNINMSKHIDYESNIFDIYISGKCFLYRQIRILIGTMIKASEQNIKKEDIVEYLKSSKSTKGSVAAMYLTLMKINITINEECVCYKYD